MHVYGGCRCSFPDDSAVECCFKASASAQGISNEPAIDSASLACKDSCHRSRTAEADPGSEEGSGVSRTRHCLVQQRLHQVTMNLPHAFAAHVVTVSFDELEAGQAQSTTTVCPHPELSIDLW